MTPTDTPVSLRMHPRLIAAVLALTLSLGILTLLAWIPPAEERELCPYLPQPNVDPQVRLRDLRTLNQGDPKALLEAAGLLWQLGRTDSALKLAGKASSGLRSPQGHRAAAALFRHAHRWDDARKSLERATPRPAERDTLWYTCAAEIERGDGKVDPYLECYIKAISLAGAPRDRVDDFLATADSLGAEETANRLLDELARDHPESPYPTWVLAERLTQSGHRQDALTLLNARLRQFPFDTTRFLWAATTIAGRPLSVVLAEEERRTGEEGHLLRYGYLLEAIGSSAKAWNLYLAWAKSATKVEEKLSFATFAVHGGAPRLGLDVLAELLPGANADLTFRCRYLAGTAFARLDSFPPGFSGPQPFFPPLLESGPGPTTGSGLISLLFDKKDFIALQNELARTAASRANLVNACFLLKRCWQEAGSRPEAIPVALELAQAMIRLGDRPDAYLVYADADRRARNTQERLDVLSTWAEAIPDQEKGKLVPLLRRIAVDYPGQREAWRAAERLYRVTGSDDRLSLSQTRIEALLARDPIPEPEVLRELDRYFPNWSSRDQGNAQLAATNLATWQAAHPELTGLAWRLLNWREIKDNGWNDYSSADAAALAFHYALAEDRFARWAISYLARGDRMTFDSTGLILPAGIAVDSATRDWLTASALVHLSRFKEALPWTRQALAHRPEVTDLRIAVSELAQSLGDGPSAAAQLDTLALVYPDSTDWRIKAGDLWADAGEWDRAETQFRLLVTDFPLEQHFRLDVATVFWDYYKEKEAIRLLQEAREDFRAPTLFATQLGALYQQRDEMDQAFLEFVLAYVEARNPARNAARRNQYDEEYEYDHGNNYAPDKPVDAERVLRNRAKRPQDRELIRKAFAEARSRFPKSLSLLKAQVAFEGWAGNKPAGTKLLTEAARKTDDRDFQRSIVGELTSRGAREEVLTFLRRQTELYPASAEPWAELGEYLARSDSWPEALTAYRKAQSLDPAAESYLEATRQVLQLMGNGVEAARCRVQLTRRHAEDPWRWAQAAKEALTAKAYALSDSIITEGQDSLKARNLTRKAASPLEEMRSDLTLAQKQPGEALRVRIELLNLAPTDGALLRRTYDVAVSGGITPRLLHYYDSLALAASSNYRWQTVRADLHRWEREPEVALQALLEASKLEPALVSLWEERADLLFDMGRFKEALEADRRLKRIGGIVPRERRLRCFIAIGQRDSAFAIITEPVRLSPGDRWRYSSVINELVRWGLVSEALQAVEDWRGALENGDYPYYKGQILEKLGRYDEASEVYAEGFRLNQQSSYRFRDALLRLYELIYAYPDVISRYAQQAIDNTPGWNLYLDILWKYGDYKSALVELQKRDRNGSRTAEELYRRRMDVELLDYLHTSGRLRDPDTRDCQYAAVAFASQGRLDSALVYATSIPEGANYGAPTFQAEGLAYLEMGQYRRAASAAELSALYQRNLDLDLFALWMESLAKSDQKERAMAIFRQRAGAEVSWQLHGLVMTAAAAGLDVEVLAWCRARLDSLKGQETINSRGDAGFELRSVYQSLLLKNGRAAEALQYALDRSAELEDWEGTSALNEALGLAAAHVLTIPSPERYLGKVRENTWLWTNWSRYLLATKAWAAADSFCREWLRSQPGQIAALEGRFQSLTELGDTVTAKAVLREVLSEGGMVAESYNDDYGEYDDYRESRSRHDPPLARLAGLAAEKRLDAEAAQLYLLLCRTDPGRIDWPIRLTQCDARLGRFGQADSLMKAATERFSGIAERSALDIAQLDLAKAQGSLNQRISELERVPAKKRKPYDWQLLIAAAEKAGQSAKATEWMQSARMAYPFHPGLSLRWGRNLWTQGRKQEAESVFLELARQHADWDDSISVTIGKRVLRSERRGVWE